MKTPAPYGNPASELEIPTRAPILLDRFPFTRIF